MAPLPPTSWGYNPNLVDDPYDPEAAKAELEAAGVTGLSMKIWAMPVQRPYNPNARRMAELIQADFAAVGVKAEIVSMEWGEYLAQSSAKDRDGAVLLGWTGDNGDPDNFLGVLLGCDAVGANNRAQWCYQPFEDLIQEAKTTFAQDERQPLYDQAQEVFKEQAPVGDHRPLDRHDADAQDRAPASCRTRSASTASSASTRPRIATRRSSRPAARVDRPPEAATLIGGRR